MNESESSLSLNPQKFHDRQVKQSRMQQPEPTIDDPDTYIGARETYKDDFPQVLRTPATPGQSVQSHTKAMPRVKQAQSLNKSNQSNAIPKEHMRRESSTLEHRYDQEPQFNGHEPVETNSMVNDSFGPVTVDQAQYLPTPTASIPHSTVAQDNNNAGPNQAYPTTYDPSKQSVENEFTL